MLLQVGCCTSRCTEEALKNRKLTAVKVVLRGVGLGFGGVEGTMGALNQKV